MINTNKYVYISGISEIKINNLHPGHMIKTNKYVYMSGISEITITKCI